MPPKKRGWKTANERFEIEVRARAEVIKNDIELSSIEKLQFVWSNQEGNFFERLGGICK